MDPDKIPMSPAALRFKAALQAEGLAKGKQEALLILLGARGFSVTAEERAEIERCPDSAKLDQWIMSAVSAGSVAEVLGANDALRAAKPRAAKPRARR
jgi:hypothetical protein